MTGRQRKIVRAILEALNALEGGQMNEPLLHAEVSLRLSPTATLAEFNDALSVCDSSGWLTGVVGKYGGGRLWCINDAGQAARLEMKG
jgi:hypothetical protein